MCSCPRGPLLPAGYQAGWPLACSHSPSASRSLSSRWLRAGGELDHLSRILATDQLVLVQLITADPLPPSSLLEEETAISVDWSSWELTCSSAAGLILHSTSPCWATYLSAKHAWNALSSMPALQPQVQVWTSCALLLPVLLLHSLPCLLGAEAGSKASVSSSVPLLHSRQGCH